MSVNSEIYLIGLAILIFLIITFLFIRKVSNNGKLKVKIEKVQDSSDLNISDEPHKNQQSFDFDINQSKEQELVILNLISMDRSMFDMDQLFGFLSNYGAKTVNNYFAFYQDNKIEKEFNEHRSGDYLILHLCHSFTPTNSFTSLTLARDEYGLNRKI